MEDIKTIEINLENVFKPRVSHEEHTLIFKNVFLELLEEQFNEGE